MKEHQCYGRSRNWRRCGRFIQGKWFCDDHRIQPIILLVFIICTAIPAYLTIRTYYFPQTNSNVYDVKNINYYNAPPKELSENIISTSKNRSKQSSKDISKSNPEALSLQVYNSTSGLMETIKPREGRIYTTKTQKGGNLDYLVQDNKIFTDYTSPDGKIKSYFVSDPEGNVVDFKLPYDLSEYTVVIPPELELRRTERIMANMWKSIHVELKWGGKVEMVLDPQGKLQSLNVDGGLRTNHKLKTFVVGHTDKTTKWMLPSNANPNNGN